MTKNALFSSILQSVIVPDRMEVLRSKMTTEQWLAWRARGVGSSDAAALFNESPWITRFELLLQKAGLIAGRVRDYWEWRAMRRGRRLEPFARRHYEKRTGILVPAVCIPHPKYPEIRASCDGLPDSRHGLVWEGKAPGLEDHRIALKGQVPKKYRWQCVALQAVTGREWVHYYSFRKGEGILIEVRRDSALIDQFVHEALTFWKEVKALLPSSRRFFGPLR